MSDRFRPVHKPLDAAVQRTIDYVKQHAGSIETALDDSPMPARERAIALTKLEEAVMWAVKGLTA